MCTSGRHGVEGDSLTKRSGWSETSPVPSLVGARGGGPTSADHRESAKVRKPGRIRDETLGSERDARVHEKSRLPDCGRAFEASVEGRKEVRLEPATLLEQDKLRTS